MDVWSLLAPLRSVVRRGLNSCRTSFATSPDRFLLVAQEPAGDKVARLRQRLDFFAQDHTAGVNLTVVSKARLSQILGARAVIEVDEKLVPPLWGRVFDHIFNVDYEQNPMDGTHLHRLSEALAGLPTAERRAEVAARFRGAIDGLDARKRKRVYLFGTGPSLDRARDRDFSDGSVIVCNTIVRDAALWHHLNPDFFAAGDAIYHFGHTAHARTFRKDLRKRLLESDGRAFFVYPEPYDAVVQREFPEFQKILIPVPFGSHRKIHVDLRQDFQLPNLGNVLNILLLPLACSLSKSVWLWGFDGRAPNDKLFWANSNKHSYPELLPELQQEHPAFFRMFVPKDKENSYVTAVHGDELDRRLIEAERDGYEFVMMHASWTHTLNKRVR